MCGDKPRRVMLSSIVFYKTHLPQGMNPQRPSIHGAPANFDTPSAHKGDADRTDRFADNTRCQHQNQMIQKVVWRNHTQPSMRLKCIFSRTQSGKSVKTNPGESQESRDSVGRSAIRTPFRCGEVRFPQMSSHLAETNPIPSALAWEGFGQRRSQYLALFGARLVRLTRVRRGSQYTASASWGTRGGLARTRSQPGSTMKE